MSLSKKKIELAFQLFKKTKSIGEKIAFKCCKCKIYECSIIWIWFFKKAFWNTYYVAHVYLNLFCRCQNSLQLSFELLPNRNAVFRTVLFGNYRAGLKKPLKSENRVGSRGPSPLWWAGKKFSFLMAKTFFLPNYSG